MPQLIPFRSKSSVLERVIFPVQGHQWQLNGTALCHEDTIFWQWPQSLNSVSSSFFLFWKLQHQALNTPYTQQDALLWLAGWVGRWACWDSDHTDYILQSCGNEIGSHLCEAKSLRVITMSWNLPSRLENRNKQCVCLMNLLYSPILFIGCTLPVDITLVKLLLYGQHLPHKYRIEKLYYICVWWNEVLPKLWCGEDLRCSLYLWELHTT